MVLHFKNFNIIQITFISPTHGKNSRTALPTPVDTSMNEPATFVLPINVCDMFRMFTFLVGLSTGHLISILYGDDGRSFWVMTKLGLFVDLCAKLVIFFYLYRSFFR